MIRFVERLRHLRTSRPRDGRWDDTGLEDVAAELTRLASADDAAADTPQASASRAAVLGAFADYQTALQSSPTSHALPLAGAVPGVRRGGHRPALLLVAVALLTALSAGAVVAAAPGGPLYATRVAAEGLFLPSDPVARFAAELTRLDERVAEAKAAERQGNEGGAQAALNAYAKIAREAAAGTVTDAAAERQFAERVRAQVETINAMGADDPALGPVVARVQVATRALLTAIGEPPDGTEPGGPQPVASSQPSGGAPSTQPSAGTGSPAGPGGSATPTSGNGPHAPSATAPGGGAPQGPGTPTAQPSGGVSGQATPSPSTAPAPTPSPTSRASAGPSRAPAGSPSAPSGPGGPSSPSPESAGSGSSDSGSGPGQGGASG